MRKLLILLAMLSLCLTGCASSSTVSTSWDNGVISISGKETALTKYSSTSATFQIADCTVLLTPFECDDLIMAPGNTSSVAKADMGHFKHVYGLSFNQGTNLVLYYKLKGNKYVMAQTNLPSGFDFNTTCGQFENCAKNLKFADNVKCVVNDKITVTSPYGGLELRQDCIVIPGQLKVSVATNDKCTTKVVVGKNTELMSYSDTSYTYYQYDELLIQLPLGMDVTEYIKF